MEPVRYDTRLPKKTLFGTVAGGKKSAGKLKKNWVDCLEEDCERANIPYGSWTEKAKIEPLGRNQSRP
jgi:hypothetical protein